MTNKRLFYKETQRAEQKYGKLTCLCAYFSRLLPL